MFTKASKVVPFIKMLLYGGWGSGKTRFSLSFPGLYVIDLERSTEEYGGEFDFNVVHLGQVKDDNGDLMVNQPTPTMIISKFIYMFTNGMIPDCKTLAIDPGTKWMDEFENTLIKKAEMENGVDWQALKSPKLYQVKNEFVKDPMSQMISKLLSLPINIIITSRDKNLWQTNDKGKMVPMDRQADVPEVLSYEVSMTARAIEPGRMRIEKSRNGLRNEVVNVWNYDDLIALIANHKADKTRQGSTGEGLDDDLGFEEGDAGMDGGDDGYQGEETPPPQQRHQQPPARQRAAAPAQRR